MIKNDDAEQDPIIRSIEQFYGGAARASDWLTVDQARINQFGAATGDLDWLHTDPARAKAEGPFGGTIAFGFWTLSMLTYFVRHSQTSHHELEPPSEQYDRRDYPAGALYGLNYGFDRVRFTGVVPVGSRIRFRCRLLGVEKKSPAQFLVRTDNQVEVEGHDRPALVAEWLVLLVYPA